MAEWRCVTRSQPALLALGQLRIYLARAASASRVPPFCHEGARPPPLPGPVPRAALLAGGSGRVVIQTVTQSAALSALRSGCRTCGQP